MVQTDTATLRRQMDFVAGVPIPEQYVDFLVDELTLAGKSTKDPQFDQPKLQAAARKLKVLVIGAGDDRPAGRHPPQPGRRAVRDRRQERRRGRHLVREHLSWAAGSTTRTTCTATRSSRTTCGRSTSRRSRCCWSTSGASPAKYDLSKHIRFQTLVESWLGTRVGLIWRATLKGQDGKTEVHRGQRRDHRRGQLNRPRMPDITGLGSFEGPAFHSAEWRARRRPEGQAGR